MESCLSHLHKPQQRHHVPSGNAVKIAKNCHFPSHSSEAADDLNPSK